MTFPWELSQDQVPNHLHSVYIITRKQGSKKQILFQISPSGKYKLPGGTFDPELDENSTFNTLRRELIEEMNIDITPDQAELLTTHSYPYDGNPIFSYGFVHIYNLSIE